MADNENLGSYGSDALGAFSERSETTGGGFSAALQAAAKTIVPATLLSTREFEQKKNDIFKLFGAKSRSDKEAVEAALVVFFSVHGTSPQTSWTEYEHDIMALGKSIRPYVVVKIIGQSAIKKFMGRYTNYAVQGYHDSAEFQDAMAERVARARLTRAEGYLAIDFVGKDGSLDSATMQKRTEAKSFLLVSRNTQRHVDGKRNTEGYVQAREIGGNSGGAGVDPFA